LIQVSLFRICSLTVLVVSCNYGALHEDGYDIVVPVNITDKRDQTLDND
jgi:hypothetical protein